MKPDECRCGLCKVNMKKTEWADHAETEKHKRLVEAFYRGIRGR